MKGGKIDFSCLRRKEAKINSELCNFTKQKKEKP